MIRSHYRVNCSPAKTNSSLVIAEISNFFFYLMLSNNSQEISSSNYIGIPTTNNPSTPQITQPPTSYDYFALIPAILIAATPLILGLRKKDENKEDDS